VQETDRKRKQERIPKRFNVIYCEELVGCVNEKSCTKRSSRTKSLKNALIENYQSRAGKNVEIMSSENHFNVANVSAFLRKLNKIPSGTLFTTLINTKEMFFQV
jgi:hypothetical protein